MFRRPKNPVPIPTMRGHNGRVWTIEDSSGKLTTTDQTPEGIAKLEAAWLAGWRDPAPAAAR